MTQPASPSSLPATPDDDLRARLLIVATVVMWGSQYPMTHDLGQRWDAYSMLLVRFPAGAAILLGLAAWQGKTLRLSRSHGLTLGHKLLLGSLMGAFGVLFTLGLAIGDPVACAVVAALAPLTSAAVAWLVDGSRPQRQLIMALFLVIPGAILASVDLSNAAPVSGAPAGVLLILAAQSCWALYSLKAQSWLSGASQVAITGSTLLWSCPFVVLAYLAARAAGATHIDWQTSPGLDALMLAALTLGALVIGVLWWNTSVKRLGLAVCALHLNLIPVVAIAIGLAFGHVPRAEQIAGAALVIGGLLIAQRRAAASG